MLVQSTMGELGLTLIQRDWLSANHVLFRGTAESPATVVDTGYARHSEMTLSLIDKALAGQLLQRIVNTHLHSDHCGGNRALQARGGVQTWVPQASFSQVRMWDEARLSYQLTGQTCERFAADGALIPGRTLALGPAIWEIHSAPGHDPDAVLLFEPQTRTLISGDALWEDRLAIIFPELDDRPGFPATRRTLDWIEHLSPRLVIPGHGAAFEDAGAALAASRQRLDAFERDPSRHLRHAARSLAMFHLLEYQTRERSALEAWLQVTPLFAQLARKLSPDAGPAAWARQLVDSLIGDGLLHATHDTVALPQA